MREAIKIELFEYSYEALNFFPFDGKPFLSKGLLVKRGLLIAAQNMHSFGLNTLLHKVLVIIKSHAGMVWEQ